LPSPQSIHWLEKLAKHKDITVFVYYFPSNVQPVLAACLRTITHPRIVRVSGLQV
jgi:hypothetical protein